MKQKLGMVVLAYLRFWARLKLKQNPAATIVGITGSAGKTSTRLAVARVLSTRGVVKHSAHANSESGISLNILGLTPKDYSWIDWMRLMILSPWRLLVRERFDYYVVEMGIDSPAPPKNMDYLLSIVRPSLGIMLNAGMVHGANFDQLVPTGVKNREEAITTLIAKEKFKLLAALPMTGTAIWNGDQTELERLSEKLKSKKIRIGTNAKAGVRIVDMGIDARGFAVTFQYQQKTYKLQLADPLPDHYGLTFAAAIAVGIACGIEVSEAVAALASYRAPAGRMRVFDGISDNHLLDSSYNASPSSMEDALKTLACVAPKGRRVAVLGDMRELGEVTERAHRELAEKVTKYADQIFLFGPEMKKYVWPYLQRQGAKVEHYATMSELINSLKKLNKTWILFKGSQNTILLERAVEAMLLNPEDAKLLCRRGSYWDRVRKITP